MNSNKRMIEIFENTDNNIENTRKKQKVKDCGCTVETNCYCDAETEDENENNTESEKNDENPDSSQKSEVVEDYYNTYNFKNPDACRYCGWFGSAQCNCESYCFEEDDNPT